MPGMIVPRQFTLFGRFIDLANIDLGVCLFDATVWLNYLWLLSGIPFLLGMPWWRCCCDAGEECSQCTDAVPNQITVDLGVGGWTDVDCDLCDQVVGEFTLTYTSDCEWIFVIGECDVTVSCTETGDTTETETLRIRATLLNVGGTDRSWRVRVEGTLSVDPDCTKNSPTAQYVTQFANYFSNAECTNFPFTVNKNIDNNGGACAGALPATSTVDQA